MWHPNGILFFLLKPWVTTPVTVIYIVAVVIYMAAIQPSHRWRSSHPRQLAHATRSTATARLWFGMSMTVHLVIAMVMILEIVRLGVGSYNPDGWVVSMLGLCMWAARGSVIVSMIELVWTCSRLDRLNWDDPLFVIGTLWMTGSWLGSPHAHSTSCIVIPCGFVIDRAILAGFRYKTECGYTTPCDIDMMATATITAVRVLVLRSKIRSFMATIGVLLFALHVGSHHCNSHLHIITVIMHVFLAVLYNIRVMSGPDMVAAAAAASAAAATMKQHRRSRVRQKMMQPPCQPFSTSRLPSVDGPDVVVPVLSVPLTVTTESQTQIQTEADIEADIETETETQTTSPLQSALQLTEENASAFDMIASMITGQQPGTTWRDTFTRQQQQQRLHTRKTQ
jgi:hypothetical protein